MGNMAEVVVVVKLSYLGVRRSVVAVEATTQSLLTRKRKAHCGELNCHDDNISNISELQFLGVSDFTSFVR